MLYKTGVRGVSTRHHTDRFSFFSSSWNWLVAPYATSLKPSSWAAETRRTTRCLRRSNRSTGSSARLGCRSIHSNRPVRWVPCQWRRHFATGPDATCYRPAACSASRVRARFCWLATANSCKNKGSCLANIYRWPGR